MAMERKWDILDKTTKKPKKGPDGLNWRYGKVYLKFNMTA